MACEAGWWPSNEESGINCMQAQEISMFRPRLGPTQPPIRSLHCPDVWGTPSLVSSCYRGLMPLVERPEREPDRSLTSVFGVNAWSCVFTSWFGAYLKTPKIYISNEILWEM